MRGEERARDRHVAFERRPEERRLACGVRRARIGARLEKRRGEPRVLRKRRVVQHRFAALGARIHVRAALQQTLDLRAITFLDRGVQRAVGGVCKIEQCAERKLQYTRVSSNRYHAY